MDIFTIAMWLGTIVFLGFSFIKDKKKTVQGIKMAFNMGKGIVFSILTIIFAIGLILTIIPPESIATFLAKQNELIGAIASALLGTVTLVPAFIAFPLIGTLVDAGVGIVPSVAFLTTLTMVGLVTYPLERQEFGAKFAIARNGLSLVFAIVIAVLMGVFL